MSLTYLSFSLILAFSTAHLIDVPYIKNLASSYTANITVITSFLISNNNPLKVK